MGFAGRSSLAATGAALALGLAAARVHAGSNNACATADPAALGATAFSNVGATTDGPSPCNGLGRDVWFTFEADANGSVVIETCGTTFDTVLAVYQGCGCPAQMVNLLDCNDDACAIASRVMTDVVADTCYLIQVGGFQGAQGAGTLTVTSVEVPDNDDCADAIPIVDGDTEYTTVNSTDDGPPLPGSCDQGFGLAFGSDIWFLYQPTCAETLEVSTCGQADYDTRLAAYTFTGVCATLQLIACNDDGPPAECPSFSSLMDVPALCGQTVLLRVGGFAGASGDGTLTLTCKSNPCDGCEGDTNGDGLINVTDLVAVLTAWGTGNPAADFNGDGVVNVADLVTVLTAWGVC